jgi:hypothetical protein
MKMKKFKEHLEEKATEDFARIYEPKGIKDIKTYENPDVNIIGMATYNLELIAEMITQKLLALAKEARMLEKDAKKDAKFFRYNSYRSMQSKIENNLKYFIGAMADVESQMTTPAMKAKGTRLGSKKYK